MTRGPSGPQNGHCPISEEPMPVVKVKGGYKVRGTTTKKPMTKNKAEKQLAAIKINQRGRGHK